MLPDKGAVAVRMSRGEEPPEDAVDTAERPAG